MSEGRLRYGTVQKVGNNIESIIIVKNAPVSFMVTTTKTKLHPENETRMLSLEVDDSEKQTKQVLAKVAQIEGLNSAPTALDYERWHAYQRWSDGMPISDG